jgi:hypothetical protein
MKRHVFPAAFAMAIVAAVLVAPLNGQTTKPTATTHELEGRDDCLMCHRAGAMEPVPDVPATHEGRGSDVCQWCHAADSPMLTYDVKAVGHELEGRDDCLMCHRPGAMEPVPDVPASHEGRGNEHCRMCHPPPSGG